MFLVAFYPQFLECLFIYLTRVRIRMCFYLPRSHQVLFLFTSFLCVFFCSVRFNDESHVIYLFVPDFFVLVIMGQMGQILALGTTLDSGLKRDWFRRILAFTTMISGVTYRGSHSRGLASSSITATRWFSVRVRTIGIRHDDYQRMCMANVI